MPLETGKGKGVGKAGFYVPTIDIRPFLDDPSSVAAGEVVEMVRDACVSTGFFQITGHGIPAALQEAVFAGSRAFFALDGEEKKMLDKRRSVGSSNRGYEGIGNQGLQEGALPDLKEGFYIGLETPASDPRVLAHAFKMMGPNLWPPLPLTTFHDPMTAYYTAIYALSLRILDIVASTLTLPHGDSHAHVRAREAREFFHEFTANDPVASIRLLHYPPAPAT
ncbi:2-oxoglutarate-dependent dioxygenase citB, partial [Lachnellula cervina]